MCSTSFPKIFVLHSIIYSKKRLKRLEINALAVFKASKYFLLFLGRKLRALGVFVFALKYLTEKVCVFKLPFFVVYFPL